MILFLQNVQNRKIHRDRKWIHDCLGLEAGAMRNYCLIGLGLLFWGAEIVLKFDTGEGCTRW